MKRVIKFLKIGNQHFMLIKNAFLLKKVKAKQWIYKMFDIKVSNYTDVPELGRLYLPAAYSVFKDYYPNCEMNTKKWVVSRIKPDWNVIDVGANIGIYSIMFGKLAHAGSIYAIEPTSTIKMLRKNLSYHDLSNVKTFQLAFGNQCGTRIDRIFKIWGRRPKKNSYNFLTLDCFATKQNLTKIDLIKVDTDGYEIEVLNGARNVLDKYNPYLLIEFSHALNTRGFEVGNLLEKLVDFGYREAYLMDANNLLLKKSENIHDRWPQSISIFPHEFSTCKQVSSNLSILILSLQNFVKTISASELLKKLNSDLKGLDLEINARLPGRGPKMEVNDAPILAELYKALDPKNHLEFGTWEGFGTSLYCSNAKGNVVTINLPDGEREKEAKITSVYPSSNYPALREIFTGLNSDYPSDQGNSIGWIYRMNKYENRVTQILADSTQLRKSDFDRKFDSIFIDGGHDRDTCVSDSKLALSLLSDLGIIIWHDFTLLIEDLSVYNSPKGVLEAILELKKIILENNIDLYWIEQTWILIGIKQK